MYVNLLFVLAAVLALVGTNRQADLARRKLTMQFGRENRLLPEAVRRKPSIGWLPTKARRRWRAAVESLVGEDASRWAALPGTPRRAAGLGVPGIVGRRRLRGSAGAASPVDVSRGELVRPSRRAAEPDLDHRVITRAGRGTRRWRQPRHHRDRRAGSPLQPQRRAVPQGRHQGRRRHPRHLPRPPAPLRLGAHRRRLPW